MMAEAERAAVLAELLGRHYRLGAQGPEAYDCYGAARALQRGVFGREMPKFAIPGTAGRWAIAAAIAAHPERENWIEIDAPEDGALVTMARHQQGYHMGVWLADDDGLVIHAVESAGVVASRLIELEAEGWRKFRFHLPA